MSHRISLTGAQGTGKSTVAKAIVVRLREMGVEDVTSCDGLGDALAAQGLATGAAADADTVRVFIRRHQLRETIAEGRVIVFDRCLLDTLAYALVLECLSASEIEDLRAASVESSRRFDQLLWLRVTWDYPLRGPRDETLAFRRAIDTVIGRIVRDHGLRVAEHAIPPQRCEEVAGIAVQRYLVGHAGRPCEPGS